MACGLYDNALEVVRVNIAVAIPVKVMESLSYFFTLQTPEHLSELRVCHVVTMFLASNVERSPARVPIEWNGGASSILVYEALKLFKTNNTISVYIKEAKGDFVFGVRLGKQVFESAPVGKTYSSSASGISDIEEYEVLCSFYFVLDKCQVSRL